jgi:hypothetical protein
MQGAPAKASAITHEAWHRLAQRPQDIVVTGRTAPL